MATHRSESSILREVLGIPVANTAGVVQGLRGHPVGNFVYPIVNSDTGETYYIRANTRTDAWNKLREIQENGAYLNTAIFNMMNGAAADADDPEVSVSRPGA